MLRRLAGTTVVILSRLGFGFDCWNAVDDADDDEGDDVRRQLSFVNENPMALDSTLAETDCNRPIY